MKISCVIHLIFVNSLRLVFDLASISQLHITQSMLHCLLLIWLRRTGCWQRTPQYSHFYFGLVKWSSVGKSHVDCGRLLETKVSHLLRTVNFTCIAERRNTKKVNCKKNIDLNWLWINIIIFIKQNILLENELIKI